MNDNPIDLKPVTKIPILMQPMPPSVEVALKLDKKRRNRMDKKRREAETWAQLGVEAIRIKTEAVMKLGKFALEFGIKNKGHGDIIVAGDNAADSIARLDAMVTELIKDGATKNQEPIAVLMQLKLEFNKQLIATGNSHIAADKQLINVHNGPGMNISFPAGAPAMIAVGSQNNTQPPDKVIPIADKPTGE